VDLFPRTHSRPQFCRILTDFQLFFTRRFFSRFEVKPLLKIPPHLAYVATLPCETLMSENKRLRLHRLTPMDATGETLHVLAAVLGEPELACSQLSPDENYPPITPNNAGNRSNRLQRFRPHRMHSINAAHCCRRSGVVCVCLCHRCKNVFLMFLTFFIFQTFFILKNVGKVQRGK